MTKAFPIAAALFVLTATTASAQSGFTATPQDSTVLDLAYPYYNFVLEPAEDIVLTPNTTEPTTNNTSTTDPFGTTEPNTPQEPSSGTNTPGTETTPETNDTATAGTEPNPASVDSTTLFVPPEPQGPFGVPPERVPPEQPSPTTPPRPRDPINPQEPTEEPRECPEQTMCPSAQEVIDRTVPQITENQWRVAIIVFGGAAAGGLIWLLTSLLFNNAHSKREQSILQTRTAVKNNNHRIDQLKNSHNKVSESIADLTGTIQNGKNPSSQQIQTLKTAGTELELFGSSETRSAYNHLLKTVSAKSNEKDFSTATKTLFSALKTDLGLK